MKNGIAEATLIDQNLNKIEQKVLSNIRITTQDCLDLYNHGELGFLGKLANLVRERKNSMGQTHQ